MGDRWDTHTVGAAGDKGRREGSEGLWSMGDSRDTHTVVAAGDKGGREGSEGLWSMGDSRDTHTVGAAGDKGGREGSDSEEGGVAGVMELGARYGHPHSGSSRELTRCE